MHPIAAETQISDADLVGGGRLLARRYDDRHAANAFALVQPELRLRIGWLLQSRVLPRAVRARIRPVLRRVGGHAMVVPDSTAGSPRRETRLADVPSTVAVF